MKRCALLVLLVVGACKSDQSGPRCEQVADHILEVTKQQMPAHAGMGPEFGDRKGMIAQCNKRNMTAEQRKCLIAARSLEEIANCGPASKPPPRQPTPDPLPPTPPAAGSAPAPVTGSGSGS